MRKLLLAAVSVLALMPIAAHADIIDDPLHGGCGSGSTATCGFDNGKFTPIGANSSSGVSGFGWSASPAQSGLLEIVILVPTGDVYGDGAISGSGIVGSLTPISDGTYSSTGNPDLATFLNLPNSKPANPFSAFQVGLDSSVTSFAVFDVVVPLTQSLIGSGSPLADTYSEVAAIPAGTDFVAFLLNSSQGGTTATAPSGQLQVQPSNVVVSTPEPATLSLFATGLGALGLFGWRRKRKSKSLQRPA